MALHTLNLWEIALGGAQICLCGFILLMLFRNRSRHKQMIPKAPAAENAWNFNTEFIIEALRQQTELAFNHILDTINKERNSLEAYFELKEPPPRAPGLFRSISTNRNDPVSARSAADLGTTDAIYSEIESLAGQGMSLMDISEKLDVPQGEVDLVLKLKRLRTESGKNKASSSSP